MINEDFWKGVEIALKTQKKSLQIQIRDIDDTLEKLSALKEMEVPKNG